MQKIFQPQNDFISELQKFFQPQEFFRPHNIFIIST